MLWLLTLQISLTSLNWCISSVAYFICCGERENYRENKLCQRRWSSFFFRLHFNVFHAIAVFERPVLLIEYTKLVKSLTRFWNICTHCRGNATSHYRENERSTMPRKCHTPLQGQWKEQKEQYAEEMPHPITGRMKGAICRGNATPHYGENERNKGAICRGNATPHYRENERDIST